MEKPTGQLEQWEWIERYWSGQLPPAENAFFEKTMQEDDRFAEAANALRFGVRLVEETRVEAHARRTIHQLQQADRRNRRSLFQWGTFAGVAAAACVAFVLYLAYAPITLPSHENDPDVLREFRRQYRPDSTDRLSLRQKQVFDQFFEGQAYLSEGQPQLAARRFEDVLTFPEIRPYFREAAQWHLIISYLKTNQADKAEHLYASLEQADEYPISRQERWKVWWHLRRLAWNK